MSSTILVTGASGTLGRYLIPELQRSGYRVRGHYRTRPGTIEGVDWRQMNFLDTFDFAPLVAECDAVIHLAAELKNPALMHRVNVEATAALLAAAQFAGARYFGYASSIVVYGTPRQRIIDEMTPVLDLQGSLVKQFRAEPTMLEYARSKVLAEQMVSKSNFNTTIDIYRPTVVADFDKMLEAERWSIFRKLAFTYRRTQYIYVLDLAAAMTHLMRHGLESPKLRPRIEAFNLCDEGCGTFRDVLDMAYDITGDHRYKVKMGLPMPVVLDLTKDMLKYGEPILRYSLGMLQFRNVKLLSTGFSFPHGLKSALRQALANRMPPPIAW